MSTQDKWQSQHLQVHPLRGIDERWKVSPSAATRITDMSWHRKEGWRTAGGYGQLTPDDSEGDNSFDGTPEIVSLHWFAQQGGSRQWLIWETANGELKHFNGSLSPSGNSNPIWDEGANKFDGTARSRAVETVPWARTQSAVFGDYLYLVNGIDEPIVFDGHKAMRAGFDLAPPPPDVYVANKWAGQTSHLFSDARFGVGELNKTCAYKYRRSFINERGQESALSEPSSVVTFTNSTGGTAGITLSMAPGPDWAVGSRLYRTNDIYDSAGEPLSRGAGENYYYLTEIPDNSTRLFMDIRPDTSLGALADPENFGGFPIGAHLVATFKDTLFVATKRGVHFSKPLLPEEFPPDNFFDLGDGDGGAPTALFPTRNSLVVFKARGIYLIKGDPASGFYAQTLFRDVGTTAPNAVKLLPGLGVVFIGDTGIYLLEGALENTGTPTALRQLDTQIPDLFRRINRTALPAAEGAVYHAEGEYWLAVPTIGSHKNDLVFIYHYEIGAWSTRQDYPIGAMIVTGDKRGYLMFGSNDASSKPGVWVYGRGFGDKGGTALSSIWEGAHVDFGSIYTAIYGKFRVYATVIGMGTNDVSLNVTTSRELAPIYDIDQGRDQRYVVDAMARDSGENDLLPLLGTVSWGDAAKWGDHRPVVVRWDVTSLGHGPAHEAQATFSWSGRGEIIGYSWVINVGKRRKILPLTEVFSGEEG